MCSCFKKTTTTNVRSLLRTLKKGTHEIDHRKGLLAPIILAEQLFK